MKHQCGEGLAGIRVHVQTAPRASNDNLRAQAGLFTVCRGPLNEWSGKDLALDAILGRVLDVLRNVTGARGPVTILRRLRLSRSEAPKLLRLLAAEGITAARLFPGHRGVLQALSDEHHWDELPARARLRRRVE